MVLTIDLSSSKAPCRLPTRPIRWTIGCICGARRIHGSSAQNPRLHCSYATRTFARRRKPGGGCKGKLPTIADKLLFLLYYYKVYPTFDVLGTQFEMARSKANENLHKLSPILYDTLVQLDLMPYRELRTPEELKALRDSRAVRAKGPGIRIAATAATAYPTPGIHLFLGESSYSQFLGRCQMGERSADIAGTDERDLVTSHGALPVCNVQSEGAAGSQPGCGGGLDRSNSAGNLLCPPCRRRRWGGGPCEAWWRGDSADSPSTAFRGPPPHPLRGQGGYSYRPSASARWR